MQTLNEMCSALVEERKGNERLRKLRSVTPVSSVEIISNGQKLLNFSSNDYLGLSQHPELKARAISFINKYGVGATASRLICGNIDAYQEIEAKLASLKGTESALILPTGFQTNLTVLPALTDTNSLILCDRYSHNSLLQGAQLSAARWSRYRHNDLRHLNERLIASEERQYSQRWILTESVYSMDGDSSDVDELIKIATSYGANLFIDEAHATGVLGENGMGLCAGRNEVAIAMGTFGKGLGSFGAYVACSQKMRDYLVNMCSGFIYSTGLPPPVLGAIDAALDLIPELSGQRLHLLELAEHVRQSLRKLGYDTGKSNTQIIPIILGDDAQATGLARHLEQNGILAPAIRPPTVETGTARIRLSLSAAHTMDHVNQLLTALRNWRALQN